MEQKEWIILVIVVLGALVLFHSRTFPQSRPEDYRTGQIIYQPSPPSPSRTSGVCQCVVNVPRFSEGMIYRWDSIVRKCEPQKVNSRNCFLAKCPFREFFGEKVSEECMWAREPNRF